MSGGFNSYCEVRFKNKKVNKYLAKAIVTKTHKEERCEWPMEIVFDDDGVIDDNIIPETIHVETITESYIDIAILLGIRNTRYGEKDDKQLTKTEVYQIIETLNKNGLGDYGWSSDPKRIRLFNASVGCNENGKTIISFNFPALDEAIVVANVLSAKFPKTRIEIENYDSYWDSTYYSMTCERYVAKNGITKCAKRLHEYKDCLEGTNETKTEKHDS